MSRTFLLLGLVVLFDLSLTLFFGIAGAAGEQRLTAAKLWSGLLYHFLSWLALYFSLILFYRAANGSALTTARRIGRLLLFSVLLLISGYLVFYWSFLIANGFPPSGDVVVFLLGNLERIPQHILQTSPAAAVGFILSGLVLAFIWHRCLVRVPPMRSRTGGYVMVALCGVLLFAWIMAAPHSIVITPIQTAVAAITSPDAPLEGPESAGQLNKRRPYQPVVLDKEQRHPVIVILIESLRRDLLDMSPTPIPFLKSLAADSIVFDKAYATASHSNYADLAFWYSQFPLRTMGLQRYPRDAAWRGDSLFTAFKAHGYTTSYISSQNENWGEMINWLKVDEIDHFFHSEDYDGETWLNEDDKFGIKMLMDKGVATAGKIEDSATMDVASRWIESLQGRQDFFLGLNLQNTHFSYVIPHQGEEPFQPADMDFEAVYFRWPEEKKEIVRNRYLNAVYNVDKILEGFVAFLKQKGLWDNSVFVVVGDSGEGFYEHGFGNHSGPMYDEVMRTFALVKPPKGNVNGPQVFQAPLSHIDIAAGTLDILGMPIPDDFQGMSPFDTDRRKRVFMHTNAIIKQNAVVEWPWKLMHTHYPRDTIELFDLQNDREEQLNLAEKNRDLAARLDAVLSSWMTRQLVYYSDPDFYQEMAPPMSAD